MKNLQAEVDNINELVKTDVNKAYTPFVELYLHCKENYLLEDLAQLQINLINSDTIDNVAIQFKALSLLSALYEGSNNSLHFKTKLFIGRLYTRVNQFHKALTEIKSALNYFHSVNDVIRIVQSYSCIGLLYLKIRHLDDALINFNEGLSVLNENQDRLSKKNYEFQLVIYSYNISLTFFLKGDYKASEKNVLHSLDIIKYNKENHNYFNLKILLIHLKIKQNQADDIQKIIDSTLEIEDLKETRFYPHLMGTIAEYKEYTGELKEASKYFKKAIKHGKKYYSVSSPNYDKLIESGLSLAFKRNHLKDIAWYSKKMQEIKKTQQKETLYYSEISLKQLDEISELEVEKKQLEEISYILGHDLKTPIRIVKNMADIILQDPDTNIELIPKIISNSKYALELINATLDFSKLTLNFNPFKKVSLTKVLNNVTTNLDSIIENHQAKIEYKELPTVYGNYSLLNQLFTNLISNALKYNKTQPIIEISSSTVNKNHVIEIKDNGIGIPKNELNKIFKLFKKSTINNTDLGTGVGLAICKKIVEMHKGTIYAKSIEAKGTSFFIVLPEH